ncbi:carbohydrate kinase family protein [Anaerorhabdus sp.]|uniref:carbohydrate kinase family protein n=1 Tax=Anaerorhabdus sp. TaxID=1872524 RepID=UPI002FC67B18
MNRVFVIGGANVDICGASFKPLQMYDSNPGVITTSFGGVGRNIAENLTRLGKEVYFISIFADDLYGIQLKKHCEDVGMNCSLSKVVHDARSSIYLAILDEKHDMHLAMSDMDILNHMDNVMLASILPQIEEDDLLVIDTNLRKDLIDYITTNTRAKIAIDPISTAKADKVKGILNRFSIFKPNKYESTIFTNIKITDEASAIATLDNYLNQGVDEPIISLGEDGVLAADKNHKIWVRHKMVDVANATGGGDAFLAAYIYARMDGKMIDNAVEFAIAAAVNTITCIHTVNPELCVKLIEETIKTLEIERKIL